MHKEKPVAGYRSPRIEGRQWDLVWRQRQGYQAHFAMFLLRTDLRCT